MYDALVFSKNDLVERIRFIGTAATLSGRLKSNTARRALVEYIQLVDWQERII